MKGGSPPTGQSWTGASVLKRIVAHNGTPFIGGGELWTIRLLKELARRGHDVEMWVRDRDVREQVRAFGIPAEVAHLGGQLMIPEAVALAFKLRRNPPDALLLTTFKKSWLGSLGGRLANVPRVVVRIGLSSDLPRRSWTYRVALRRWVDVVVTNSRSVRDEVLRDLPEVPEGRVRTVWNGVEIPERVQRGLLRQKLGLGLEIPLVGSAGRMIGNKRHDRLIQAVSGLNGVHCVLAGDGAERGALEELCRSTGCANRVHFLGHRQDLAALMSDLDAYVVPSDLEGMSNAMLEAMAVGVPVVSTRVSGATDALEPFADGQVPGVIVPPDALAIRSCLSELLGDPSRRARMSKAAIRRVRERFDAQARADEWEALLFGPLTNPPT